MKILRTATLGSNVTGSYKKKSVVNIIHDNTCYKSMSNPSCIGLIIINSLNGFQNTSTLCTWLSDFHKLLVTA